MSHDFRATVRQTLQRPPPGLLAALIVGLCLSAAACSEAPAPGTPSDATGSGILDVAVVHHPLAVMAARIGGDAVRVDFPAEGADDPAFWSPAPDEIKRFQQAELVLLNGAGYSRWVPTAPLPGSRLVDTTAARAADLIELTDGVTHTHGAAGAHSHTGTAFTTWLDLDLAADQARAVVRAFSQARPALAERFTANGRQLLDELALLDARLKACVDDRPVLGSHPVYQYLARRYGLDLRAVHWEPGDAPDAAQWAELDALLAERPATLMLWEDTPLPSVRAALLSRGLTCVVVSPCAQPPATGDWLDVVARDAAALCGAYGG